MIVAMIPMRNAVCDNCDGKLVKEVNRDGLYEYLTERYMTIAIRTKEGECKRTRLMINAVKNWQETGEIPCWKCSDE